MLLAISVVLLAIPALASLGPAKSVPFVPDCNELRRKALEAEKKGDFATALQLYEDVLDSGKTDTKATTRQILFAKLRELRAKVAPNTDESKAGKWRVKVVVFKTTDVKHKDDKGKDLHSVYTFTDEEIDGIRHGMEGFRDLVWKYTDGNLRIVWNLEVIQKPLTKWGGYPDPGICMPYLKNFQRGDADSIFAYAKATGTASEKSDPLNWICLAGTMGALPNTQMATWIGFNCGAGNCTGPDGEVQLHEWLHAAEMTLSWVQGYDDVVDWTSDGGGYSELWGIFTLQKDQKYWLPYYQQIMRDYVTRKMWRELSCTQRTNNPWLNAYVRDVLVRGPFTSKTKAEDGLETEFINEKGLSADLTKQRNQWKKASAPGKYLCISDTLGSVDPGKVIYVAFTVESDRDQPAQLRNQRDGGVKLWQDGKLLFTSSAAREWWHQPNVIDLALKKGSNLFVLKLNNVSGDWALNIKITDPGGNSLAGTKIGLP